MTDYVDTLTYNAKNHKKKKEKGHNNKSSHKHLPFQSNFIDDYPKRHYKWRLFSVGVGSVAQKDIVRSV